MIAEAKNSRGERLAYLSCPDTKIISVELIAVDAEGYIHNCSAYCCLLEEKKENGKTK